MNREKLKLLERAKDFVIEKSLDRYMITSKFSNLCVVIDDEGVRYYVTGIRGGREREHDMEQIDVSRLEELREFCGLLTS